MEQEYVLIYLDVLGYKNKKSTDPGFKGKLDKMFHIVFDNAVKQLESKLQVKVTIKAYSDNFLICCEALDPQSAHSLIVWIADVQYRTFTSCGLLIRGAITVGSCQIDPYVYGEAFDELHDLEDGYASWSRVLVSPTYLEKYPGLSTKYVVPDCSGKTYKGKKYSIVDYLSLCEVMSPPEGVEEIISLHMSCIQWELDHMVISTKNVGERVNSLKIAKKLYSLCEYHNHFCQSKGLNQYTLVCPFEKDLIDLEKYQLHLKNLSESGIKWFSST